uniref:G_PROTEIN_RECEP_F3_4 domain-containing protein n=1 Tax=Macrostomum lignano TaxID=282301 RepID=A0A1I8J0Y6_9PLAT
VQRATQLLVLLLFLNFQFSSQTEDQQKQLQEQQKQSQDTPWRQKLTNFIGRDGKVHYWPIQSQRVFTPGDIYLGGLMMVHSRSEDKVCGRVMHQGGLQALESMLFTIDYINQHDVIGDGIKLGSFIKDDCDRDTYGLDQSVDFIKGKWLMIYFSYARGNFPACLASLSHLRFCSPSSRPLPSFHLPPHHAESARLIPALLRPSRINLSGVPPCGSDSVSKDQRGRPCRFFCNHFCFFRSLQKLLRREKYLAIEFIWHFAQADGRDASPHDRKGRCLSPEAFVLSIPGTRVPFITVWSIGGDRRDLQQKHPIGISETATFPKLNAGAGASGAGASGAGASGAGASGAGAGASGAGASVLALAPLVLAPLVLAPLVLAPLVLAPLVLAPLVLAPLVLGASGAGASGAGASGAGASGAGASGAGASGAGASGDIRDRPSATTGHDNIPLITGVVGAPSSITSNHVASLLKLFDIPQISFFSTAPQLSNKNRFPYFLRTIPSDKYQAEAIVEIIKVFNWSYVSIVYEDSKYGREAFEELEKLFRLNNICPALVETLPRDSKLARVQDYYTKIERLVKHRSTFDGIGASGVVVFGSDQEVGDFMSAVRDLNCTDKFSWIGSDGWGARPLVYKDNNERAWRAGQSSRVGGGRAPECRAGSPNLFGGWKEKTQAGLKRETEKLIEETKFVSLKKIFNRVEGAVTVQPLAGPIKGFEDYFLNLTPANNKRNPWFAEFWEDYFECRVPGAEDTPYNMEYKSDCPPGLRMTRQDEKFAIEPQLQFVSDAVMAFAVALKNLKKKLCTAGVVRKSCIEQLATKGSDLLQELKDVRFTGLTGMDFQFTKHSSDGPPRYKILNFQRLSGDSYQWEDIGLYNGSSLMPECPADAKRQINPGECRCWVCVACPEYAIVSGDREQCVECQKGQRPSADRNRCEDIALEYLTYGHPIAVVALIFASLGVLVTCFAIAVFIRNRDTAVVKASGKELSFLLLLGILFCYLMTFVLCARPNDWLCGTQQFGVGFAFSICYSALLIKTNRIERIFRAGRRTIKRPKFISPLSQVVMFCLVTSVQIVVLAVWMRIEAPKAVRHYPSRDKHQLVCASLVGSLYLVGLVHPMLLIVVCTFYACLTRNIPEAFNESKHIGFTMYSTCVIWLGFVPCYFSTAAFIHIRIATLSFSISLSATVSLACLFGPKLYIILFRPERNVRQSMMASTRRQHSTRDGSVLHHVNNNNNSNSNCGGDQSQHVLLASSMASGRGNNHQQSRTDISTQAD